MEKQRGEKSVDLIPMALTINSSVNSAEAAFSAASGHQCLFNWFHAASALCHAWLMPSKGVFTAQKAINLKTITCIGPLIPALLELTVWAGSDYTSNLF